MNFLDRIDPNRILARTDLNPHIHMRPGDSIELTLAYEDGTKEVILRETVNEEYLLTEAIAFKIDDDDYRGVGGAFLAAR